MNPVSSSSSFSRTIRAIGLLAGALVVSGCISPPGARQCRLGSPVVIPSADATPPEVIADFFLPDGRTVSVNAANTPQTITSAVGGQVTIIAKATDLQGVRDMQIWAGERRCAFTGSTARCSGPGLLGRPTASNPDGGAPGGTGCTERLTTQVLSLSKTASGEVSFEVTLRGTNFGGQEASLGLFRLQVQ